MPDPNKTLALVLFLFALAPGCKKQAADTPQGTIKGGASVTRPAAKLPAAGEVTALLALTSLEGPGVAVQAPGGGKAWTGLKVGDTLAEGSIVRCGKGARARLTLAGGGTVVHLDEETRLELKDGETLALAMGALLVDRQQSGGEALDIATPQGRVKVTGTKLHLRVATDLDTVDVTRGTVQVSAGAGKATTVEVGAGERAELRKGKGPRVVPAADLTQVTRWTRDITPPSAQADSARPGFGSLTARVPGQGKSHALSLASHKVRVVVRDNVARTEIEQRYHNAGGSTLEGTYRFPLPVGASISRLALYVGNRLEEGEIVERRRAKAIFKKIVDDTIRPRDPALLEWVGGRMFQMKIFPIPPRSSRRVVLAYTQVLPASYGRYRYVYPMTSEAGKATNVGNFSLQMKASSSLGLARVIAPLYPVTTQKQGTETTLRYEASDFRPAASFVVEMSPERQPPELQLSLHEGAVGGSAGCPGVASSRAAALSRRAMGIGKAQQANCGDLGGFFMAVLRPELPTGERAKPRDHLFVLDSSYSTGERGWALQAAALEAFLGEMDLRGKFNVMACHARCTTWEKSHQQPSAAARKSALAWVRARKIGGASDVQGTFEEAGAEAARMGKGVRVIYMGDGKPSAGELREPQLARLVVNALGRAGASLDMIQVGDDAAALFMTQATRRLSGAVHTLGAGDDVAGRMFDLVAAQYRPTLTDLKLTLEGGLGVHHVYPGQLASVSAGSELVLVGRYGAGGSGAIKLKGKVGGRDFERRYPVTLAAKPEQARVNGFIPRIWARHHLEALSSADYNRNHDEIVRVSKRYSVMSRATAFLVLENERMYREFRVKRNRNRQYWKGEGVASEGLKDQPEAEKSGEKPHGVSGGGEASGRGAKSGGTAGPSPMDKAPDAPAMDEAKASSRGAATRKEMRRSLDSASREDLDDLAGQGAGDGYSATDAEESEATKTRTESMPAPEPRPMATPAPKAKRKPASTGRFAEPPSAIANAGATRPSKPSLPRRFRRPYGYFHRWVTVSTGLIQPMLTTTPSTGSARLAQLRAAVARDPLRRAPRRALQSELVRQGAYDEALAHAIKWASLDSDSSEALRALGDVQLAAGQAEEAARSYGSQAEVNPYSTRIHLRMSRLYRNKGEARRACAHLWSMVSIRPHQLSYNLDLVRCLAPLPGGKTMGLQLLSELSANPKARRHASAIGRALASLQGGAWDTTPTVKARRGGAIEVRATWSKAVDLDLALITPRGRRLSALQGVTRGEVAVDSLDGATAEVLRMSRTRPGTYRLEITRPAGASSDSAPISGTVIIRVHGKSRTIPFVLSSAATRPLAQIKVGSKRIRKRVRYR